MMPLQEHGAALAHHLHDCHARTCHCQLECMHVQHMDGGLVLATSDACCACSNSMPG
jgi:hypothetical protein